MSGLEYLRSKLLVDSARFGIAEHFASDLGIADLRIEPADAAVLVSYKDHNLNTADVDSSRMNLLLSNRLLRRIASLHHCSASM